MRHGCPAGILSPPGFYHVTRTAHDRNLLHEEASAPRNTTRQRVSRIVTNGLSLNPDRSRAAVQTLLRGELEADGLFPGHALEHGEATVAVPVQLSIAEALLAGKHPVSHLRRQ